MKRLPVISVALALTLSLSACSGGTTDPGKKTDGDSSKQIELEFYFPVAVGGPVTKLVDALAEDFTKKNPNIKITPVFGGSYQETMTKVATAVQGKNAPDMAVLATTDTYTLLSMNAVESLTSRFSKEYFDDFFEGFVASSKTSDDIWSVPFQRSTTLLYYNKDAFKKAGLDPEKPPKNWDELREMGKQLIVKEQDKAIPLR